MLVIRNGKFASLKFQDSYTQMLVKQDVLLSVFNDFQSPSGVRLGGVNTFVCINF